MALEDFYEDFWRQDYEAVSDGMGGLVKRYSDKERFLGAISTVSSDEAVIAYGSGTKTIYRISIPEDESLSHGDVVRRVRDNRRYRITSDSSDRRTPDVAQARHAWVTAEVIA